MVYFTTNSRNGCVFLCVGVGELDVGGRNWGAMGMGRGDWLVAPADEVIIEVATATPEPKVNLDCDSDAEKSFEDYERWTNSEFGTADIRRTREKRQGRICRYLGR